MRIWAKFLSSVGLLFLAVIFVSPDVARAESVDNGQDGNVSCFDYYRFQSVEVSAEADRGEYAPGETVVFKGELVNKNDYPVVDGYVFVRVSRVNPDFLTEGHNVIDEFFALEKVALDAGAVKPAEWRWQIPASITSGEYRADYFFSVGKKFNLGGLPFSNEVIIGSTAFEITGASAGTVSFDRSATKVNNEPYKHIGAWPRVPADSKVIISQPLKNIGNKSVETKIEYDLYFWDSLNDGDRLDSRTEKVIVPARGSLELKYEIPAVKEPVYYLKITATTGGEKSIVNIRVTSKLERPRLNYPALTKFPLEKGEVFTLFSCFHNSSGANTEGKVLLTLSDKDGQEVGKMEYAGRIASGMMADKKELLAEKRYDYLNLRAVVLDKDGKIVDSYETVYDCKAINSDKCQKIYWPYYLGAIAAFLLIVAALWWRRRRHNDLPIVAAGLLILVGAWHFQSPEPVLSATTVKQTKSDTVTGSNTIQTYHSSGEYRTILSWNASVTHSVKIDGTTYGKDLIISKGDSISFKYWNDGSYNGTEGAWDTPYFGDYLYFDGAVGAVVNDSYVKVEKTRPAVTITSSDSNVIVCSTLDPYKTASSAYYNNISSPGDVPGSCQAVGYGTAKLTASIGAMTAQVTKLHFSWNACKDGYFDWTPGGDADDDSCGRNILGTSITLPAASSAWTITVPAPVTADISANPVTVEYGGSSTLTSTCTNAGYYKIYDAPTGGTMIASGAYSSPISTTVSSLITTTTYHLACLGDYGTAEDNVTVNVNPYVAPPTVTKYKCSNDICISDGGDGSGIYTEATCGGACSVVIGAVNGVCDNSVVNTCSAGDWSDLADTATDYQWECLGSNDGMNSGTCSKTIDGGGGGNYGCDSSGACVSMSNGGFSTSNCNNECSVGGGSARYKCLNNACTRDDTSGTYVSSNCDSACSVTGNACGDDVCASSETCSSCDTDCGACPITPTYSLTSSNNLSITQVGTSIACSNKTTIAVTPFGGYSADVALAVGDWGGFAESSHTFSADSLTAAQYDSGSEFSVCAESGASPGSYTVRVESADGKSVEVRVSVLTKGPDWQEI